MACSGLMSTAEALKDGVATVPAVMADKGQPGLSSLPPSGQPSLSLRPSDGLTPASWDHMHARKQCFETETENTI